MKRQFLLTVDIPDNADPTNDVYWSGVLRARLIEGVFLGILAGGDIEPYDTQRPWDKLTEEQRQAIWVDINDWVQSDIPAAASQICESFTKEELDTELKNLAEIEAERLAEEDADVDFDDDMEDDGEYLNDFADPGGNSALRAASPSNPRNLPCPNCEQPNRLTPKDVALGYQCDRCADKAERGID